MRTQNGAADASARFRMLFGRAWRWVGSRAATTRWTLATVALVALVTAGFYLTHNETTNSALIANGRAFAPDVALKISKVLFAKQISVATKDGRISVPSDRLLEAESLLLKAGTIPPSFKEVLDKTPTAGPFESPSEREQRLNRLRAQALEAAIQDLDESLSATVIRHQIRTRSRSFDPAETVKVAAVLKAKDDKWISPETIEAIKNLLLSIEPDLKPESLVLIDHKGRPLLDPANPALVTQSWARIREEQMTSEVATRLDWIEGVRVSVKLDPSAAPAQPPAVRPPVVVPNVPMNLEPEPAPTARGGGANVSPKVPGAIGKARILIQVPNAHYRAHFKLSGASRQPSPEDLMPYVAKTEDLIHSAVAHVVPAADLADLKIQTIDLPDTEEPLASAAASEPLRSVAWWIPAAIAAGTTLAAVLAIAGVRLALSRRPLARAVPAGQREGFDLDDTAGNGPTPSERVRELVRMDPQAAAGVLQRWIGQGGDAA